jgi:hypothetical protein
MLDEYAFGQLKVEIARFQAGFFKDAAKSC